jgi:hypothetical protein
MIKPQIFLISTIGFLCYALGMNYVKPQKDPYPGSVTSTTKIAKYKDMESKFISQFTFNKYFKPWAGKTVYKGGQRVIGNRVLQPKEDITTSFDTNYSRNWQPMLQSLINLHVSVPLTKISLALVIYDREFKLPFLGLKQLRGGRKNILEDFGKALPLDIHLTTAYNELEENWKTSYFKTDPHLSLDGALLVFNTMAKEMQAKKFAPIDPLEKNSFKLTDTLVKGHYYNSLLGEGIKAEKTQIAKIEENISSLKIYTLNHNQNIWTISESDGKYSFKTGDMGFGNFNQNEVKRFINPNAHYDSHVLVMGNSFSRDHTMLFFVENYHTVHYASMQFYPTGGNTFFTNYNITKYCLENNIDQIFIFSAAEHAIDQIPQTLNASLAITDSPPLPDAWVNMKE